MSDLQLTTEALPKHRWCDAVMSADGPPDPVTRYVLLAWSRWLRRDAERAVVAQSVLARQTGLGRRTVQRHLQRAATAGWLIADGVESRGRWYVAAYRIGAPGVSATPRQSDAAPHNPPRGVTESRTGRHAGALDVYTHIDPARARGNSMAATAYRTTQRLRAAAQDLATSDEQHAHALQQLERLQALEAQETVNNEELEELEAIERTGGRVNGISLADQAKRARQRIEARRQ